MSATPAPRPRAMFSVVPALGLDLDFHARRTANDERRLLTLLELGREAAETHDEPGLCSIGLLTLMGYVGTSRAAMWTCGYATDETPHLADAHGFQPDVLEALTRSIPEYGRRVREDRVPTIVSGQALSEALDDVTRVRAEQAGVATLCALAGSGEVVGYVALGHPVSDKGGTSFDGSVLDAACGLLGVSIVNVRLIARLRGRTDELLRANEELAQLDRMKSHFMSNINHELRTPVAIIQGAASCLRLPDLDPAEGKRFVEMIEINCVKLTTMIQTLLDFSVLGASDVQGALESLRLDELADTYQRGRRDRVAQSGHHLTCEPAEQPVMAYAEEKRVFAILDRLVENATRFTPNGTRISIRATTEVEGAERRAVLVVEDDGPGIEPEKLDRVFRVFEQGDGSSTRRVGGLGIGLAVARRQAEVMGGTLDVQSEPGRGARFLLRLRAA